VAFVLGLVSNSNKVSNYWICKKEILLFTNSSASNI